MIKKYETFHTGRKLQTRFIGRRDFTYRTTLVFLDKYVTPHSKILDIGCGVGSIDFYLGKAGNSVIGVDVSRKAVEIAKKSSSSLGVSQCVDFRVVDFPMSVPSGKFNVIICSEVLEHLKDDRMAVSKISNLLMKNGVVIASSPSVNAPLYKIGVLKTFDTMVGHLRRYSIRSFCALFEGAGLKILEVKKTEGVIRNFLFTNPLGGTLLKVLNKWPFSILVNFLDDITVPIFGESNIYIVAIKK